MHAVRGLALVLLAATTAAADPAFVTIDRQSQTSEVGLELSDILEPNSMFHAIRVEPHAQYIDAASGFGGYALIPIGSAWGSCMQCASASSLGDLELGGLFAREVTDGLVVVAHAGIALPTSSSDSYALDNMVAPRIEDLALEIPKGTTLRFGVSPIVRSGPAFARLDLGIDVNLSNRIDVIEVGAVGRDFGPILHAGGGAGFDVSRVSISGELAAAHVDSNGYITAALAVRAKVDRFRPYAAVIFPFGNSWRSFDVAFTAGFESALLSGSDRSPASRSAPTTPAAP